VDKASAACAARNWASMAATSLGRRGSLRFCAFWRAESARASASRSPCCSGTASTENTGALAATRLPRATGKVSR
jgi:hypothetical protein